MASGCGIGMFKSSRRSDNIRFLKMIVQRRESIPFREQRWFFGGRRLRNDTLLADLMVDGTRDLVLHLVRKRRESARSGWDDSDSDSCRTEAQQHLWNMHLAFAPLEEIRGV